jgi:AcrR family transcriptional regulator
MAVNRERKPETRVRKAIPTEVKDSALVAAKRGRIVEASVALFIRKGFHTTTTREIAREAGISIGALYEYVGAKEDVLYLVCDAIHREMESSLREEIGEGRDARETLHGAIDTYVRVCDRMQDSILLIYREMASLDEESRRYVLEHEERITGIFERILRDGAESKAFRLVDEKAVALMAHTVVVLGHMWAFRRWFLHGRYSVEEYIESQRALVLSRLES